MQENYCLICLDRGRANCPLLKKCNHCKMMVHSPCLRNWRRRDKLLRCPMCRRVMLHGLKITRNRLRQLNDDQYVCFLENQFETGAKSKEDIMALVMTRSPENLEYQSKVRFYEFLVRNDALYSYLRQNVNQVLDWIIL